MLSLFVVKAVHYGGAKTNGVNNIPPRMRTAAAVSFAERKQANWNVRGAWKDSFWLDFDGGWVFPWGTNHLAGVEVVSFGQVWATPFDTNAVASAGAAFEIVPGLTTFSQERTPSNTYRFAWTDAALGRDTNALVSAALELFRNGDVSVTTNGVPTTTPRVHPSDPDGDGLPSAVDPNPAAWDGDLFGPRNELPPGANTNAYCYVDLVASGADAEVVFTGDGPSNFADSHFMARAGATNHVVLLIGKGYEIRADEPIACVGTSSSEIEVTQVDEKSLHVRWPVTVEPVAMRGSSFRMSVWPNWLGGGFTWTNRCCAISSSDWMFTYACNDACHCGGCVAFGYYGYEGYRIPAVGGACGCTGEYDPRPDEEDDGPHAPGASATFTKGAVIFEDGYWNTPTNWVERRSTSTSLHCVAHGGPNGGHVRFGISGAEKLDRVSGHLLPVELDVGAGKKIDFTVVYEGLSPSAAADDIVVTTTFTENAPGATQEESTAKLTSVQVELTAVYEAPANPCTNRHVYGVGEKVKLRHFPSDAALSWFIGEDDFFSDLVDGNECDKILQLHFLGGTVSDVVACCNGETYHPTISLVEPQAVVCNRQEWNGECLPKGQAGGFGMQLWLYISPMNVSFQGIDVSEIPCETVLSPNGYYATTNFDGVLVHNLDAGAGYWHHVSAGNYWCIDEAKSNIRKQEWSNGTMTWNIPIQWYQRLDANESWMRGFVHSYGRLIGASESAYQQLFEITESGTIKVSKHQHWIERTTNDVIRLDGATVHDGNH